MVMHKNMSMKKAALLNMASKYIVVIIQLVYSAILARLLTPNDYGIFALVNVFVSFFAILADMGVGNAIIQNQSLDNEDVQSIYAWSLHLSVRLAIAFCLLAIPIALFYNNTVYYYICPLLSIAVFFSALNMVPKALIMKEKYFITIAVRQVVLCIVSSVITILMAIIGLKYYSLVIYSIINAFGNYCWNLKNCDLKLRWKYEKNSIEKVKSFSNYLFSFNVLNYFSRNLDNILIGKFQGEAQLGFYNKAYQLMLYPMNNFTNVITPVLLPFLSKYQSNKEYIYRKYLSTVKLLSLVGIYITVFCFFCSEELVLTLYGKGWKDTVPCFMYLSISIWSQMVCALTGSMFQIMDQTKLQFKRGLLTAGTTILAILIGANIGGIIEISLLVTIAYLSNFITMLYFLIHKVFKESVFEYIKNFIPDFCIAFFLAFFFVFVDKSQMFGSSSSIQALLVLIVKVIMSGGLYLVLLFLFRQIKYFDLILPEKIREKIGH